MNLLKPLSLSILPSPFSIRYYCLLNTLPQIKSILVKELFTICIRPLSKITLSLSFPFFFSLLAFNHHLLSHNIILIIMPPIFNNKKVYLRRKSLRLQSRLFYISLPLFLSLGIYMMYHRSPQNIKYVNAYSQSMNTLSNRQQYYTNKLKSMLGLSVEPQDTPTTTQQTQPQISIVRNPSPSPDSNSD